MTELHANNTARLFFALWPQAAERAALAAWQPVLKKACKGRVMREANLHATLVFLGNVEASRVAEAEAAAQQVQGSGFELHWDRLRYWAHNHIVHAAPAEVPVSLLQLQQQLAANLQQRGFSIEQREYLPHVTLIRNARCGNTALPELPPVLWKVSEFALVQSVNAAEGTHYEVLARFSPGQ